MKNDETYSLEDIKELGKTKCDENLLLLINLFDNNSLSISLKREVVSSIGRQVNNE